MTRKSLSIFLFCLGLLSVLQAQPAYDKIIKEGATYKDHQFYWQGKRNRGNGLLGSGGMNYRYNKHSGRYTEARSMRKNLWGVYCDGSYSGMFNNVPMAKVFLPGGYSGTLGFCYEYDHYGQVIVQTGVGLRWQSVGNYVNKVMFEDNSVRDAQGYCYTLIYDFYDRCDYSQILYAQVPVLVGSYFGPFYYMAGLKFQMPLWGQTQVKLKGSTVGLYEQYLGLGSGNIYQEMDNHGLRSDVPEIRTGVGLAGTYKSDWLSREYDVLLSAEIGWEWSNRDDYSNTGYVERKLRRRYFSKRVDTRVRIAIFADWGMLNQNEHSTLLLYKIPAEYKWDFPEYEFNHIFATDETLPDKQIHNFFVGIKLTALIGFPLEQICRLCGPFHSEREYR